MCISIPKGRIANHTLSVLSLSLASILINMGSYAVTPEQYQEQRSDAFEE